VSRWHSRQTLALGFYRLAFWETFGNLFINYQNPENYNFLK
jgi:hypothetical protein